MSEKITVEVTAGDIAMGVRGNPCYCPIAIAVRRAARVDHVSIRPIAKSKVGDRYIQLPEPAKCFIFEFDEGNPVQPFTFELEAA